jgi:hypothetical protein
MANPGLFVVESHPASLGSKVETSRLCSLVGEVVRARPSRLAIGDVRTPLYRSTLHAPHLPVSPAPPPAGSRVCVQGSDGRVMASPSPGGVAARPSRLVDAACPIPDQVRPQPLVVDHRSRAAAGKRPCLRPGSQATGGVRSAWWTRSGHIWSSELTPYDGRYRLTAVEVRYGCCVYGLAYHEPARVTSPRALHFVPSCPARARP